MKRSTATTYVSSYSVSFVYSLRILIIIQVRSYMCSATYAIMVQLKRIILYAIIIPIMAMSNEENMNLLVNDSESLNDAFNLIRSCSMSTTNYSISRCNSSDSTILNQCGNSSAYLICCDSHPICYSSIEVKFMGGTYLLNKTYKFTNLRNVKLSGNPVGSTSTTIKCSIGNTNAGIAFIQIKNLVVEHIKITDCGMRHASTSISKHGEFITHLSALYVQNSTDLILFNVNISNSNGTGLSIVDTNGTINIISSFFSNNRVTLSTELNTILTLTGGGGIFIEYTECAPGVRSCNSSNYVFANNSVITIENCVFQQNRAFYNFNSSLTENLDDRTYIGFGSGGGLSLQFNGQEKDVFVHVTIVSSNFSDNEANNGGGLSISSRYNTSNIHLNTSGCYFVNNYATYFGGGGVVIGFVIFSIHERVTHNTIIIENCSFQHNRSPVVGGGLSWHGGTELLGTRQTNYFTVRRCLFAYNQALYGSAIQINKEYFDLITNGTFINLLIDSCNFTYNSANVLLTTAPSGVGAIRAFSVNFTNNNSSIAQSGVGVVSASKVNIQFRGYTEFSSNILTPLVGDEAELGFHNNSVTIFHENRGFLGGAILLMSGSWIKVHYNSTLMFLRNVAVINGGAIYVHFATLFDYLISFSCFIRYYQQSTAVDDWNANFIFIDNKAADNQNNSIFATTLRPCQNTYSRDFLNKQPFCFYSNTTKESSKSINIHANYLGDQLYCMNKIQGQVSTASIEFCNISNEIVYAVPGKVHDLNVCITDELDNQITNSQFVGTCVNTCTDTCADLSYDSSNSFSNIPRVLPAYRTNNGSIQLAGTPGSTCHLQLQTIEDFQITGAWLIELLNCPPGFVYRDNMCSCLTNREQENAVILGCEQTSFRAFFNLFYWIGYRSNDTTDLLVAPCPYEYCYEDSENELLPGIANKTILDKFVCGGSNRTGTLCGKCIDGYSVTLNSPTFACNKCNDEYKLGVLYLILSYILPVTILFVLIMRYDIRMTTGPIGSFIFFSQLVSSEFHYILIYTINANNPTTSNIFSAILGIYSISNLDFFNYDIFNYCIFQRAGTIDIVAFELLLSLYPVILIISYALVRKYYYVFQRSRCTCCAKFNFSNKSITHAISAFLVMCFAKINLQAFTILIPAEITHINDRDEVYKKVVYLQGGLEYFKEMPHTLYMLVAILFIIIVIGIPTLILLLHPLMMKIVVYFRWGESKPVLFINKCLMIDRLKPIIDAFQGNYKDKLQFFAGLQIFFYRTLFFLLVVVTTPEIDQSLLLIAGYLVAIILIHNLAMPFEHYRDNAVYSVIYVLLLAIVIIELYTITSGVFLDTIIWLQIILCLLPLCCFASYCVWRLIKGIANLNLFSRFQANEIVMQVSVKA